MTPPCAGPRPLLRLLMAALLPALLLLAGCSDSDPSQTPQFVIGLITPLSGPFLPHVPDNAARLAVDEANARGGIEVGGRRLPVRLVVVDNKGEVETTLSAVRELANRERASAVVGPYLSRQAIPAGGVAQSAGILMLSPSSTNPETTRDRPFVFRACFVDNFQGLVMARFAFQDLALRRAAVLYDATDAYCRGVAEFFRDAFRSLGGTVTAFEGYSDGGADYGARLSRIRDSRAQALLLPNFPPDLSTQIHLARNLKAAPVLLGTDSWHQPEILAQGDAEGAYFSTAFTSDMHNEKTRLFLARYVDRFGIPPINDEALTYDAFQLLFRAAEAAGSVQPAALRAALAGLTDFTGVTGSLRYEGTGDPVRSAVIARLSGGRALFHKEFRPDE